MSEHLTVIPKPGKQGLTFCEAMTDIWNTNPERIQLTIMSRGRITEIIKFYYLTTAVDWIENTFINPVRLRYNDYELVYKSGDEPITIIVTPI